MLQRIVHRDTRKGGSGWSKRALEAIRESARFLAQVHDLKAVALPPGPSRAWLRNSFTANDFRPNHGAFPDSLSDGPPTMSETENELHRIVIGEGWPQGGTSSAVGIGGLREWVGRESRVHHQ